MKYASASNSLPSAISVRPRARLMPPMTPGSAESYPAAGGPGGGAKVKQKEAAGSMQPPFTFRIAGAGVVSLQDRLPLPLAPGSAAASCSENEG